MDIPSMFQEISGTLEVEVSEQEGCILDFDFCHEYSLRGFIENS